MHGKRGPGGKKIELYGELNIFENGERQNAKLVKSYLKIICKCPPPHRSANDNLFKQAQFNTSVVNTKFYLNKMIGCL